MRPTSFPRRRESFQMKTNGFASILLLLIVVLSFGGLFYYAVSNPDFLKPRNTPEIAIEYVDKKLEEQKISSSISPIESETTLKTYTNTKYKIALQYPISLIMSESDTKDSFSIQSKPQENVDDYQKYVDEYFSVGFTFYKKTDYETLPEYVSVKSCDLSNRLSIQSSGNNINVTKCRNEIADKFTPFELSNIKGITGIHTPYEQAFLYYIFKYGDTVIVVSQAGAEGTEPSKNSQKLLLNILTTLQSI